MSDGMFLSFFDLHQLLMQDVVDIRQWFGRQGKTEIVDAVAAGDIESFIMCLDLQLVVDGRAAGIDIRVVFEYRQLAKLDDPFRESIEHGRVGLEVDEAAGNEELLIEPQEFGMREPPPRPRFPQLRIGEGEPDLRDFIRGKIVVDLVDLGAQECGVGDVLFETTFRADIDAVPFEVYAQEIPLRVHPREPHRIFPLPARQLECQGMLIFIKFRPLPRHAFGILQHIGEVFYRLESDEFFLAHGAQRYRKWRSRRLSSETVVYWLALIMLRKKQVISMIRAMPDSFDRDDLFERILLIDKVGEGRRKAKTGKELSAGAEKKKLKKRTFGIYGCNSFTLVLWLGLIGMVLQYLE